MTPPVFAHGHLRLYLLRLLDESPMHGYDLIQSLGERFGGTYTPSAGTIYPRLAQLEKEGLIESRADGRKTVYSITDAGRSELQTRHGEFDEIDDEVADSARRLADEVRSSVDSAMRSLRADLAAAAREARTEARSSGRIMDTSNPGAEARMRLHEADVAISEFRLQLRADLRAAAAADALPAEAVTELKAHLATAYGAVRKALGRLP